jgi:hypothetical protein
LDYGAVKNAFVAVGWIHGRGHSFCESISISN